MGDKCLVQFSVAAWQLGNPSLTKRVIFLDMENQPNNNPGINSSLNMSFTVYREGSKNTVSTSTEISNASMKIFLVVFIFAIVL